MVLRYPDPVLVLLVLSAAFLSITKIAFADRLELKDGTVVENCFVRDEGTRVLVWESMADVGTSNWKIYPRSQVKGYKIERDESWDAHPNLPDLSVTFIEMNPKLAGLHGRVNYDKFGRPSPGGGSLSDLGELAFMEPEKVVEGLKFKYEPGEEITLSAHVKNLGFKTAEPFEYLWMIDDREIGRGRCDKSLKEMEEITFNLRWRWQEGLHHVTFKIITDQPEIATINNELTDPLWGWGFTFVVHKERVNAWHQNRTAYGTFSFEDFYRWHVEIMNRLFAASIFPSAPEGIRARVRLDRIVYADDVQKAVKDLTAPDGIRYDQGLWIWFDDQDRNRKWKPPTKEWRNRTEWSLPHELGHQLGLTDWYALDDQGYESHVMPDNGDKVAHFMTHPITMMHWHGPHLFSEADAGYLNMTWDKPRGHYGDHYFAIPRENFLKIVDVNGFGVPGAKVEVFQRGVVVDPNGRPREDHGVRYFPVIEDGNFNHPVPKEPVIVGITDENGIIRLPNRPVKEVRTLNGFHRRPNPFGNIDVVGRRGLMLVRVTKYDRPCYYWLEIYQFVVAWFRGHKDRFTILLKTPYGSEDSPLPPRNVRVTSVDKDHVRVTWSAPPVPHEGQYLERAIGFRVYRRISSDGLNDRPWFPVATVGPETKEVVVDLREFPRDIYWFSKVNRFAVTTIGELGLESELVEVVMPSN
jgi:hypothetical protein